MIKQLIDLLRLFDYYGEAEEIEIAKGGYKLPETIKEGLKIAKRRKEWQRKKH